MYQQLNLFETAQSRLKQIGLNDLKNNHGVVRAVEIHMSDGAIIKLQWAEEGIVIDTESKHDNH